MSRRLAIAISVAAASITIAIGVTAGALMGWFSRSPTAAATVAEEPAPAAPEPPPAVLVPVTREPSDLPAARVAVHRRDPGADRDPDVEHHDHEDHDDHDHDDHEEDDDD